MSRCSLSFSDLDLINIETITEIQKEIDPCDMISLMFLLYEAPQTALEKLVKYQHVAEGEVGSGGLLHEWASQAHPHKSWKWKLLEGLATCQLYTVIRKLGFHKQTVIQLFQKDNEIAQHIDPIRKIFHRVCENMDTPSYSCFKKMIRSEFADIQDHSVCEVIFLELMCQKVFTPETSPDVSEFNRNIIKLSRVIATIPDCKTLSDELINISKATEILEIDEQIISPAVPSTSKLLTTELVQNRSYVGDFFGEYQLLNGLQDLSLENLKSDDNDQYCGLSYIISQENFSRGFCNSFLNAPLENRPESAIDKVFLRKTLGGHSIKVISHDNLSRQQMLDSIKSVVDKHFKKHYRFFLLFILSHGSKDHVYSVNSERVSIIDIEDLLDSDDISQLRTVPKVLILQACQVDEVILVTDGPQKCIKKSNMITFCSTAPGYEAYRIRGYGSLFILALCKIIEKHSSHEHLTDLFTKVISEVERQSLKYGIIQLPIILRNTLTSKIMLKKQTSSLVNPERMHIPSVSLQ